MLFFSTTLNEAFELRKEYGGKYFIIFPIFLPDWHVPDERCNEYLSAHGYDVLPGTPRYVSLAEVGYIQFWSDTKNLLQCKGFSAVIPGYDDLLLERSPQLAPVVYRDNGRTLIEQFQQALDSNAEEILIYGWNEYFEGTTIEPTLEYGEFYFELTARIIKKIKEGKRSCITIDLPLQSSMPPKYLNEELEISSQRYQDGIPRWDKDYYLAKFSMISEPFWENEKIVYKNIQVTNVGLKHWDDTIEDFPVLVGIQLLDDSGSVFQEGRGRLGGKTIAPGQSFITSLTLEIKGLGHGVYTVRVGMVCENKFWFSQIMLGDIVL